MSGSKSRAGLVFGMVLLALAIGMGGFWLGDKLAASRSSGDPVPAPGVMEPTSTPATPGKKERKLLYYRNPMGLPDTSPTPKKTQVLN